MPLVALTAETRQYCTTESLGTLKEFALFAQSMAQNVVMAEGNFEWDDLGSWNALARHLKSDPEGNCAVADFIHVDAVRNIIFDARTKGKTPIAIVGLRDSILVQTDDVTMLAHKSQSQKLKEMVRKLSENKEYKHLV